jgi:mono/diheme cytochrome c family protein
MSAAKGARGAGVYPALANNPKLAAGDYVAGVVVNGLRGMPQFGTLMSDEQAAEVVNFVRTNFGNAFTDKIRAEDVKKARR